MRTFKMIINPTKNKKDAAFCQYFKTNTADSKCMYNTANFYIRNTMTGLKKISGGAYALGNRSAALRIYRYSESQ